MHPTHIGQLTGWLHIAQMTWKHLHNAMWLWNEMHYHAQEHVHLLSSCKKLHAKYMKLHVTTCKPSLVGLAASDAR